MTITVSRVTNVDTTHLSYLASDFANASSWYSDALDYFVTNVQKPIDSGHVWTDGGQPDASTVMEINRSALGIGQLGMDSASRAILALYSALSSAQGYLLTSLDEASRNGVKVNDDGTTYVDETLLPGYCPEPSTCTTQIDPNRAAVYAQRQDVADRIKREVQGYLGFAAVADSTCKTILNRIASHTPTYASTADKSALSYNQSLVHDVLSDHDMAVANQTFWDGAVPQPTPEQPSGWDKFWHGVGDFFSNLAEHAGELALETLSIGGGVLLTVLGSGMEVGGVALDLTGAGAVIGVPANAAGVVVIGAGATLTTAGALGMGGTMNQVLSESMSDSGGGSTSSAPRPPTGSEVATKPTVEDTKLGNIVNDLYRGTKEPEPVGDGTTADAVRNERITGKPTKDIWHFKKAKQYLGSLYKWLAEHPNASASDRAVAQQEIDNLNNALGPKENW
ncbi:MAG: hypothetical protein J2P24_02695 [Streptosporangiales bacterium]|nr:hypothetical protein [Streptosporangiales bacterium]MBO0891556.1 hypothetical protein [Acidothermales bacterium]